MMLKNIVTSKPELSLPTHLFKFTIVTENIRRLVAAVAFSFQKVHLRTLQNTTLDHFVALTVFQVDFESVLFVIRPHL